MSTVTGNIVLAAAAKDPTIPGNVVASALAIIVGGTTAGLGFLRLGFLVDFISLASISAYMTGSALNIAVGQVPTMLGITSTDKKFNTRASTYLVVIRGLRQLGDCTVDAAMGLTALLMLYLIRYTFNTLAKKQPHRRKLWFFCNTLRTAFVILLYTMIAWLVNLHVPKAKAAKSSPFKILGHVPRGFTDAGVPRVDSTVVNLFTSQIPVSIIVVLIEHISIAKSFGRINNYTINPSQELIAIGVTNLLAPFLGGYPATGSFSRTAIKSKAGVRTPLAGLITAVVVLISIYALTAVFFYIPSASLSAVIIHAVGDLITPPNVVYQFWRINPIEVFIFFGGVILTVFTSIEDGIYLTVCASLALFLWRVFKAQGRFLGRVKVHSVVGDHIIDGSNKRTDGDETPNNDPDKSFRNIYLPIEHGDGSNPEVHAEHPYPGIFIYRFSEGYNYPNANHYLDYLTKEIFATCKRTNPFSYGSLGDRPWNDPGESRKPAAHVEDNRPTVKAVILDFSSVNNVDITSVQNLIDVRNQLDRYAQPERVQWHFACINNRWTKRALVSAGFGYPSPDDQESGFHSWKPIFSVANIEGSSSAAAAAEDAFNRRESKMHERRDLESGGRPHSAPREIDSADDSDRSLDKGIPSYAKDIPRAKIAAVQGLNRPFFHIDLTSALQSAISTAELQDAARRTQGKETAMGNAKADDVAV
jgi:solute carrier family 26 (sodium-independent sulfate anion transporter), member 11